jgi:hypothetical protein
MDQAPLTWLESLEKYSIDKWGQLEEQFTNNFAGTMGRSGTRMDLLMVKQEQGETLCKYMRLFRQARHCSRSPTRKSSTFSKTVSTTVAPLKTSVATARAPLPSSKT